MLHEANVARFVAVPFVTLAHAVDVARTVAEALVRAAVAVARDASPARWALAHAVDAFPAVRAVAGALEQEVEGRGTSKGKGKKEKNDRNVRELLNERAAKEKHTPSATRTQGLSRARSKTRCCSQ